MKIREIIKAFSDIGSAEGEREAYLTVEYLFGAGYASVKAEPEREYDGEKVKEVLMPLLANEQEKAWLEKATLAI